MKNRRIAIIAFVLVAVMAIGIGYATLTDSFVFGGTVSGDQNTAEFNDEVKFTSVTAQTIAKGSSTPVDYSEDFFEYAGAVAGETAADQDKVVLNIPATVFQTNGDKFVVTATITNNSDVDVYLTGVEDAITVVDADGAVDDSKSYFKVTYNNDTFKDLAKIANTGGTIQLVVTIEMVKTPVETVTASLNLEFQVTTNADGLTT